MPSHTFEREMIYMMLVPRRNSFDLFDNFLGDDDFFKKEHNLMKTDIKEKKDKYVITMDLPGYEKDNIDLSINNGYLEVYAKITNEENDTDDEEKYVRRERFYGECSRNFYVGEDVTEEDIEAEFKNGILKIEVPKKEETEKLPEMKKIVIK